MQPTWVVKQLVPDDVYTDREEFLDYFYRAALNAVTRRSKSTVLLGQRRLGKTEIFARVVNRLFSEQDPRSPQAVVPIYFSFPDWVQGRREFAVDYLENFMRYYVGFYTQQPQLVIDEPAGAELLERVEQARALYPFSRMLDLLLQKYRSVVNGVHSPDKTALWTPRRLADIDDTTHVVFLDELQNARMPEYDFDVTGWLKEAVESPNCPHFVTGSAMSILAREIIGRGAMFGRFQSKVIKPLSNYWGAELARRVATYQQAELPKLMAPVVSDRCGGNPFYITALIQQSVESNKPLSDEDAITDALALDITSGFIWAELYDQVNRWIQRVNQQGITKWILYLSALEENEDHEAFSYRKGRVSLERIQQELERREGQHVPIDTIRDVLVKLSRGDLLEYLELGGWFRKTEDPILLEFLRVWGRVEVEGRFSGRVETEVVVRYRRLQRQIHEYKGYLAEIFMAQVLLSSQSQTLPGHFFHREQDVKMHSPVTFVRHRYRFQSGRGQEIDLLGSIGGELWVCQSKWTQRPVEVEVLHTLRAQADTVQEEYDPYDLHMWLFAHNGLTAEALAFATQHGILWSTRPDLDGLLAHLGLCKIPEIPDPRMSG